MARPWSVVVLLLVGILSAGMTTGCGSLSTWLRSNLEGVPQWIYEPQTTRNQMAFVGKGSASQTSRARSLAIESILDQISTYLGKDLLPTYFARLGTTGSIDELRLKITQEFVMESQGTNTYYLLAVADAQLLSSARSLSETTYLEQLQSIRDMDRRASELYRQNRDIDAAMMHARAAILAADMPVERGTSLYAEQADKMERMLSAMVFSLSKEDPATPSVTITARRGSRRFSPPVVGARLQAVMTAVNGVGQSYTYTQTMQTNSNGQAVFTSDNPGMVGSGFIVFSVDFREMLAKLSEIDAPRVERIGRMLDLAAKTFAYARKSPYDASGLILALMEYSLEGGLLASSSAHDAMAAEFASDGLVPVSALALAHAEDDVFLDAVKREFPGFGYMVMGKVGVLSKTFVAQKHRIVVEGELSLIDLMGESRTIHTSGPVVMEGSGDTELDARTDAFKRFGVTAASVMEYFLYP